MRFALILALAAGCNTPSEKTNKPAAPSAGGSAAEDAGPVLATVNGASVGEKQFIEAASRTTASADDAVLTDEEKQDVLKRLVDDVLLYEEALTRGLDKDDKVKKVMVNTLLREEVYASVRSSDFTDEELQAYFESHKDEFVVPEKVQIKRILIKVTDERPDKAAQVEAKRIHKQLNKDLSKFKELASAHSEDPYRRRGGDVGFVAQTGKPGLDQAVVDKAFTLEVNKLSDVFKTDDGYNLVMVANRRDKVERTFQQMKGSVLRKVKNERLKELYEAYVGKLREGASINMEDAKLTEMKVEGAKRPSGPGLSMSPRGGLKTQAPGATTKEDDGHGH